MTIKLYRSTETGAPQTDTVNPGSLINILRACLVDGFGSRTSAGWSMPHSDLPNNLAAFQGVGGNDLIRIDDNLDYRWASVLGFATMSDINTGTEQYPTDEQLSAGANHYRIYKRFSNDEALYNRWDVVVDDEWFYFIGHHNSTAPSNVCGFFFGQYECANSAFTHNYLLTGYSALISSTATSQSDYPLFGSNGDYFVRRHYLNSIYPEIVKQQISTTDFRNPNPFSGELEFEQVRLRSSSTPYVRYGHLPKNFRLRGNDNQGFRGGEIFVQGAKKYLMISENSHTYIIEYEQDAN